MRHVARSVPIARPVQAYAIRLTLASHPGSPYATPLVKRYVRYGASPRAAQALVLAGEDSRPRPAARRSSSVDDIRSVALPALRHRILLNFEGEADEVSTDTIVDRDARAGVCRVSRDKSSTPNLQLPTPNGTSHRTSLRSPLGVGSWNWALTETLTWRSVSTTTSSRSWSTCTWSRSGPSRGTTAPIG